MKSNRSELPQADGGRPKKTVAIVGSNPRTRDKAPFDDPSIEIWMFNSSPLADWCKRLDVIFELHKREEYTFSFDSQAIYWQWLRKNTGVRVYMQEEDYQVPMSVKYPLEAICNRYLSHLRRGDEMNRYFTSSVCYALGLAVMQGFERIELYGIEMETNTEYIYQREGVGLWVGIALGLGVEVWMPDDCAMLNAPLYGYDQDYTGITREELEEHRNMILSRRDDAKTAVDKARGALQAISGEIETARKSGRDMASIAATLGQKFSEAQVRLEKALIEYGGLESQIYNDSFWMTKLEKHAIARGQGQEVMALNAVKLV